MKQRFYLVYNTETAIHVTRFYETMEEAEINKEFLEKYFGVHVRLKVDEMMVVGTKF